MLKWFNSKKDIAAIEIPVNAPDKRISAIFAAHQQPGQPTEYLLKLGLKIAEQSFDIDLEDIAKRIPPQGPAGKEQVNYINIFPGEHYRLLAAVTKILQPKLIIELGTHLGYSSLCMKKYLPHDGKLVTFDIIPWNKFEDTILGEADLDHQLEQRLDDVTIPQNFKKYESLFAEADIIFMDALKDGVQEYQFLENFSKMQFNKKCLFIFDDIRLWNMLDIWYNLSKPKLDMTSFGHWSGTGLVEWS